MKAERRHELQQNTLASVITDVPLYVRFHANKIMVGIIIVCLLILLVRHRMNAAAESQELVRASLMSARNGIEQLRMVDFSQPSEQGKIQERKKLANQVGAAIEEVIGNAPSSDTAVQSQAILARGDLNWRLANLSPLEGAATQPALQMERSPEQYLDAAQGAYQEVLRLYSDNGIAKVTATLGLAAIAENRRNWDEAGKHNDTDEADKSLPEVFHQIAKIRKSILPIIRTPVYLGSYGTTQPSDELSTLIPFLPPTTTQSATTAPAESNLSTESLISPATAPANSPATLPAP
jgi:hypothetical protein